MEQLVAIDISQKTGSFDAKATFRIPEEMVQYLKTQEETQKIVGFVWDGSADFGILLNAKPASAAKPAAPKKAVRIRVGKNPLKD